MRTDGQTDGRTDGQTDGQRDRYDCRLSQFYESAEKSVIKYSFLKYGTQYNRRLIDKHKLFRGRFYLHPLGALKNKLRLGVIYQKICGCIRVFYLKEMAKPRPISYRTV
jgi:hypothetical protein